MVRRHGHTLPRTKSTSQASKPSRATMARPPHMMRNALLPRAAVSGAPERSAMTARMWATRKAGPPMTTGTNIASGSAVPPTRWRTGHANPATTKRDAQPIEQPPVAFGFGGVVSSAMRVMPPNAGTQPRRADDVARESGNESARRRWLEWFC